jgi:hypothetical protein
MAAGLGYKEFTTGDVLTAADANGYLASQVVMVFASAAARTSAIASPQEGMFSFLKDTNATEYYSGSAWVAVGGSSGKIGQVLSTTKSDTFTTTSTSFTDITGLSQSITPVATSSKILVFYSVSGINTAGTNRSGIRMMRGATAIAVGDASGSRTQSTFQYDLAAGSNIVTFAGFYLDSPSTTSATTYKAQAACLDAGTTYINRSVSDTDSSAFSRVASTITVMEILA